MSEGLVLAGRYRLIRKLGQGGMGSVWCAQDLTLGAEVAVKLIDAAFAESPEAIMRFKREAQAAAVIRSTHVVQILDHGIDNGTPFIAMELLNGESLAERLESVGKLSAGQTGLILGHAARALTLAHEHGIVHRDMKPENIFLVREGEEEVGKVLDFGIARQRGGLSDSGGLKTQTGAILGTPFYMSPEQATGQAVDHLTDIWAFAVIASECLTGRRVFDSDSLGGLFHAICMKPMPVPSQLGEVPPGFDEWFARAAAREKAARLQTIKEAAAELRIICGRASGVASAERYSSRLGGAVPLGVQSVPGNAVPSASKPAPSPLQTTTDPSALTVPELSLRRRGKALLALAATGVTVVAIYFGWRSLSSAESPAPSAATSASAPVVSLSTRAVESSDVAPAATSTTAPKNAAANVIEAPPATSNVAEHAPTFTRPARVQRQGAPTAAPRATAGAMGTAAREATPVAPIKKPTPAPAARDDNAAGI